MYILELHIFKTVCNLMRCMARNKISFTVTLPPEIYKYLKDKVERRDFKDMAHGIEVCVLRYKEAEERGERP